MKFREMTYRNENVTKINDANDTKIKKKTNLSFFSGLFTIFFFFEKMTSKCGGITVSRALRKMAFLVREQKKTKSCLFAQNHEFWSH